MCLKPSDHFKGGEIGNFNLLAFIQKGVCVWWNQDLAPTEMFLFKIYSTR